MGRARRRAGIEACISHHINVGFLKSIVISSGYRRVSEKPLCGTSQAGASREMTLHETSSAMSEIRPENGSIVRKRAAHRRHLETRRPKAL